MISPARRFASVKVSLSLALLLGAAAAHAGGDWNDGKVQWRSYEEGLAAAKKEGKPICLIVFTEWCGHCQNYSGLFHDPKVVEMAKNFVMIRLDQDKFGGFSKQYAPDGQYIPRTMFLTSSGVLDPDLRAPRDPYRYFYDEGKAEGSAGILAGMSRALDKLAKPAGK